MHNQHHERDTHSRASLTYTTQSHEWLAISTPNPLTHHRPPYKPYLADTTASNNGSPMTSRAAIPVRCQVKTQITPHTNASRHQASNVVFDMSCLPRHTRLRTPGECQFHTRQCAKGLPPRHHLW